MVKISFDKNQDGIVQFAEILAALYTILMYVIIITIAWKDPALFQLYHVAFVALGSLGSAAIKMAEVLKPSFKKEEPKPEIPEVPAHHDQSEMA